MTDQSNELRISPFCIHLATKKSFFRDQPALTEAELLDGSQACWCMKTQTILGPDREIADPEDCRKGRGCFVSLLDVEE